MGKNKLQRNFKILIKFLIILETYAFALITCPKEILFQIGVTSRCESETGSTIQCDGTHSSPIKKVFIDCTDGYYNGKVQTLTCDFTTGEWSSNPERCSYRCDGNPKEIELNENKVENKWYAEILKRPPISGEVNTFPGIILNSRLIMTLEKFFNPNTNYNWENFVVKVYKPGGSSQEYTIDHIEYKDDPVYLNDGKSQHDRMAILVLTHNNFIQFDDITQPTCLNYDGDTMISENRWFIEVMRAKPEYNLRPDYPKMCIVPHVDQRIALSCFRNFNSDALRSCPKNANIIQSKCQIGYQKIKSNEDDIVSSCVGNRWIIEGNGDNDCKMICGDIGHNIGTETTAFISGGTETDIKNAPWHAGIYTNGTSSSYDLICSGSIIHKNIVISAAHCFYNKATRKLNHPSNYLVGAGKRFHSFRHPEDNEQFVRIKQIEQLRFSFDQLKNDIVVLIVEPNFRFTLRVKPVCIDWVTYEDSELPNGTVGHIFGWGATSGEASLNNHLLTTNLNYMSSDDCRMRNKNAEITEEGFCAVNDQGSTACKGDSGGGYVIKKKFGSVERYVLWGIISSGVADEYCSKGGLTIFTNIQYYRDRIIDIIAKSRQKLNNDNLYKLFYHQIYGHSIWTPLQWVQKEKNLELTNYS